MKIRGLLAGLLVAVAIGGCTGSPTAPRPRASDPAHFDEAPPPPPDTLNNRGGGAMGTGT